MGTGLADYILPASAMPQQLVTYIHGPYLRPRAPAAEAAFPDEALQRILTLLRARTGHDFAPYKESTIRRRIERRMNVHQVKEPQAYVRYLQENPHEIDMLFSELLISVTNFFRDPQAFEVLTTKALPALLQSRTDSSSLRVWVPGCATGEEAYSLAIMLREVLEATGRNTSMQVFGTDLDARAVEWARAGAYGANIAPDVAKERMEQFFNCENNTFRVRKEVRESLIFATHDLIKDPPFTKLDLISCRNLLIYLDTEAQRRLLPVFHYALRPGGLLFLGPSETIGGFTDLFETVDAKWKIYRRKETLAPLQTLVEPAAGISRITAVEHDRARLAVGAPPSHTTAVIERMLLARFAPTTLVVGDDGGIVYIHGRTGAYLEPSEGQPRNNVLEMARQGLARPLSAALRQAAVEKREIVRTGLAVKTNGDFATVNLSVAPMEGPEPVRGLFLVTIVPSPPISSHAAAKEGKAKKVPPGRIEELEQELRYFKESLQTTIEELETSNEELEEHQRRAAVDQRRAAKRQRGVGDLQGGNAVAQRGDEHGERRAAGQGGRAFPRHGRHAEPVEQLGRGHDLPRRKPERQPLHGAGATAGQADPQRRGPPFERPGLEPGLRQPDRRLPAGAARSQPQGVRDPHPRQFLASLADHTLSHRGERDRRRGPHLPGHRRGPSAKWNWCGSSSRAW